MREKQIEEIARDLCESYNDDGTCYCDGKPCNLECENFTDAQYIYEKGYRKQEWISVDERLPEDGVWVLGYSAKSRRGGLCNCLKSYVREFGNYDDTTHWLPLPEFPKTKGE